MLDLLERDREVLRADGTTSREMLTSATRERFLPVRLTTGTFRVLVAFTAFAGVFVTLELRDELLEPVSTPGVLRR